MLSSLLIGAGIWVAGKVLAVVLAFIAMFLMKQEDNKGSVWAGYGLVLLSGLSALGAWVGLIYYIIEAIKS